PDQRRDRAAEDARVSLDVVERLLLVGEADPDTGDELRYEAAEPRVLVVLGGARLPGDRSPECRCGAGAVLHDALQRVGDEIGGVLRQRAVAVLVELAEHLAVRTADECERL